MYKILLITYRALKFSSPQYINSLIEIYKPSRSGLRSSAEFSLAIPKSKRTWGDRAFASAAPHLWNSLPKSIHLSESVDIFKSKLKTHLMEGIFLEWRNTYFERSTLWAPWASFGWKCLRVTNICIIIIINGFYGVLDPVFVPAHCTTKRGLNWCAWIEPTFKAPFLNKSLFMWCTSFYLGGLEIVMDGEVRGGFNSHLAYLPPFWLSSGQQLPPHNPTHDIT